MVGSGGTIISVQPKHKVEPKEKIAELWHILNRENNIVSCFGYCFGLVRCMNLAIEDHSTI